MRNPQTSLIHRPWPLPSGPWVMAQNWHDVLFARGPVPVESLQPLIPARLELDLHEGQTWLGVVPSGMTGVRPRLAALPPGGPGKVRAKLSEIR